MDSQTLQLIIALQCSLCTLLVYVNRTSDYAKRAQAVALEAARVIRESGGEPAEVPGMEKRKD